MQAELAMLPAAKNETHPCVEGIYRGTGVLTAESTSPVPERRTRVEEPAFGRPGPGFGIGAGV